MPADHFQLRFGRLYAQTPSSGTYFAKDAQYSDRYCPPLRNGRPQANAATPVVTKRMLLAAVSVGRYTVGNQGMKDPPFTTQNGGVRYDSLVNNVESPSIFVVQDTSAAYPAYTITYECPVPVGRAC